MKAVINLENHNHEIECVVTEISRLHSGNVEIKFKTLEPTSNIYLMTSQRGNVTLKGHIVVDNCNEKFHGDINIIGYEYSHAGLECLMLIKPVEQSKVQLTAKIMHKECSHDDRYLQFMAVGWTDELLVEHKLAEWLFKEGDWAWTTDNGWVKLSGGTHDDRHPLQANERTYTTTGYEWRDDKSPSLLRSDPINGTKHPVGFKEFQDEIIKSIADTHGVSVEILTAEKPNLDFEIMGKTKPEVNYGEIFRKAAQCGNTVLKIQSINEWIKNTTLGEKFVEKKPDTMEFNNIKDNLDFIELVDKFKDTHSLRGGQKADGTWYLKGVEKS